MVDKPFSFHPDFRDVAAADVDPESQSSLKLLGDCKKLLTACDETLFRMVCNVRGDNRIHSTNATVRADHLDARQASRDQRMEHRAHTGMKESVTFDLAPIVLLGEALELRCRQIPEQHGCARRWLSPCRFVDVTDAQIHRVSLFVTTELRQLCLI